MSQTILESIIQQYLPDEKQKSVHFIWHGGEPLLAGFDFFQKAIDLQKKFHGNMTIFNSIQTNGTLLNDKWCSFFAAAGFYVGLSMDGPTWINDSIRKGKGNDLVSNKIRKAISQLKEHIVVFNLLTAVSKINVQYPVEVFNSLIETGCRNFQFIPIAEPERFLSTNKTPWHFNTGSEDYGKFLIQIFDIWIRDYVGKVFINNFESVLTSLMGNPPLMCTDSDTCDSAIVVLHNGDIYPCDHYILPEFLMGNIMQESIEKLLESESYKKFVTHKKPVPESCYSCNYLNLCKGGCPKQRFSGSGEEAPKHYLCSAMKAFYDYTIPYFSFMANELLHQRSPANIMKEVAGDKSRFITSPKNTAKT